MRWVWPRSLRGWIVSFILGLSLNLVFFGSPARAYDATYTPEAIKLANIAYRIWHKMPNCPQGYHLYVEPITDQPPEVDGTHSAASGEAPIPGCWMRLIPEYWADNSSLLSRGNEVNLCTIYVHEYGHNLGYPHTTDPNSVMNPLTEFTTGRPKACQELEEYPTVITYNEPLVVHHKHHRRHHDHR